MSIINTTILKNRNTTRVASIELYGDNGKTLYTNLLNALYNWRVADVNEDNSISACNEAFDAARALLAIFNEGMEDGRKLRFCMPNKDGSPEKRKGYLPLTVLRDGAIRYAHVKADDVRDLEEVIAVCKRRTGEKDTLAYYPEHVANGLEMVKAYCEGNNHEMPDFAMPKGKDAAEAIHADNAAEIMAVAECVLDVLKKDGLAGHKEVKPMKMNTFRKYVEDTIADMMEGALAKTLEQIAAEEAERKAYRKAHRKTDSVKKSK